jgi:hypothetical protein
MKLENVNRNFADDVFRSSGRDPHSDGQHVSGLVVVRVRRVRQDAQRFVKIDSLERRQRHRVNL